MRRLIQFFVFAPLAILLLALSVANRQKVTLSLDPFNAADPAISFSLPLFWLIFGFIGLGVLLGGFVVWVKQGRFRREARVQRKEVQRARNEALRTVAGSPSASALSANPALPAPSALKGR
ncbi:MAG: LapA family protein [Rhizobiales bacterium]|nr:LapA family protein [Hyphomicrobiales bacterium]